MAVETDRIPIDDPANPAIRRWFGWAIRRLLVALSAVGLAGWWAGRLLVHSGTLLALVYGCAVLIAATVAIAALERTCQHRLSGGAYRSIEWGRVGADAVAGTGCAAASAWLWSSHPSPMARALLIPVAVAVWRAHRALRFALAFRVLAQFGKLLDRFEDGRLHARVTAQKRLVEADRRGVAPADLDPETIAQACDTGSSTDGFVFGFAYAYYAALDRGEVDDAVRCLDQMEAKWRWMGQSARAFIICERAYLLARHMASPSLARGVLRRYTGRAHDPICFRRASAAIYLAERDPSALRACVAQILPTRPRPHASGVRRLLERLVREMSEEGARLEPAHRIAGSAG